MDLIKVINSITEMDHIIVTTLTMETIRKTALMGLVTETNLTMEIIQEMVLMDHVMVVMDHIMEMDLITTAITHMEMEQIIPTTINITLVLTTSPVKIKQISLTTYFLWHFKKLHSNNIKKFSLLYSLSLY